MAPENIRKKHQSAKKCGEKSEMAKNEEIGKRKQAEAMKK